MAPSKSSSDNLLSIPLAIFSMPCVIALCSIAWLSACSNPSSNEDNTIINVGANGNANSTALDGNNSPNTGPEQADGSTNPQEDSAGNLTTAPSVDVAIPVAGGIPDDCLFDVSPTNLTFCYQPTSRTLSGWQSDGSLWWSYDLPRTDATNEIHALQVVNGNLHILAELKADGLQTGFEVSTFAFGGAFIKTVAINKFQDYSFLSGHRIQVADINDNLIIVGDYGLSTNNILPNEFHGTFVAVFNTTSDQIENSRLFPQLRQTNPMLVVNSTIKLELEHLVYDLSPTDLTLSEPTGRFQSIPFSRNNYIQKKRGFIGFIEKPPFEQLHTDMNNAFSTALRNKLEIDPTIALDDPIACSGGGTVQQSFIVDEFNSEVRTTTFSNCVMSVFSANGVLLEGQTRSCGQYCQGTNKTLRALSFEVSYTNGESWSVDGFITTSATLTTYNPSTGTIENQQTNYANMTEINEFSMSDDQITISLTKGRYKYDGTLRQGSGLWSGSGTLNYASGVTETFTADLARSLRNGAQVSFSGQMDANRSDGTALFIGVDAVDSSGVLYSTTSATGVTIQAVNGW